MGNKKYRYSKNEDGRVTIWNGEGHVHCTYPYHMEKEVIDHVGRLNLTHTAVDELDLEERAKQKYPMPSTGYPSQVVKALVIASQMAYQDGYTDHAQQSNAKYVGIVEKIFKERIESNKSAYIQFGLSEFEAIANDMQCLLTDLLTKFKES